MNIKKKGHRRKILLYIQKYKNKNVIHQADDSNDSNDVEGANVIDTAQSVVAPNINNNNNNNQWPVFGNNLQDTAK